MFVEYTATASRETGNRETAGMVMSNVGLEKRLLYQLINLIFLNCLVYKMSANIEKHPLQVPKTQGEIFKCLILSRQQPKTQGH